jgi:diguanylate cyclase (GGDEF)-like protein/PAS domain S-box-containing protein
MVIELPEPSWFTGAFEELADIVVAFDQAGQIVYVNAAAERVLGVERESVIGQNMTEWVHPDDLERALEVTALIMGGEFSEIPVTPAFYRVRCRDGSWLGLEVNGTQLSVPPGEGDIVTVCRYSGDRAVHDEVLERLTQGDPIDEIVALLPELGRWRHPTERYAIAITGDSGDRIAPGSDLPPGLDGSILDEGSPWSEALASGREVTVESLDGLPPSVRRLAEAEGLRGCKVVPVPDLAGSEGATITVWATPNGPPLSIHTYSLDNMRRVLALVLRWRQQVRQLTSASFTDHLTGAASRSRFFAALEPVNRSSEGDMMAILYVDLDRFKPVNDAHGHRTGDEVLVVVAERLNAVVRPADLVARIGGDEFAILCRGLNDIGEATAIADRVIATVGQPITLEGLDIQVDASVGIASTVDVDVDGDALLDAADRALYRAKREGRGRWSLG